MIHGIYKTEYFKPEKNKVAGIHLTQSNGRDENGERNNPSLFMFLEIEILVMNISQI